MPPESKVENNIAKDALCPKCRVYREVVWTPIVIAEVHQDGKTGTFKGLEMRCRICEFVITNVGWIGPILQMDQR